MTAAHRRPLASVDARDHEPTSILHDLSRVELGRSRGVVVTDALEMKAISDRSGVEEGSRAQRSLRGADALCLGHDLFDKTGWRRPGRPRRSSPVPGVSPRNGWSMRQRCRRLRIVGSERDDRHCRTGCRPDRLRNVHCSSK
jgi:hypothetical protein